MIAASGACRFVAGVGLEEVLSGRCVASALCYLAAVLPRRCVTSPLCYLGAVVSIEHFEKNVFEFHYHARIMKLKLHHAAF